MKNARLVNMFKLSGKVTIYVPSTMNINEEIDNAHYVEKTAKLLSDCFGGSTSTNALGYWISPSQGLVREKTVMVFAYCSDEDLQEHIDEIIDHAEYLRTDMMQDAIAVEINGEMYFI